MYKYSVWCMRVCVGDVFHSCFQWFSIYILVYVYYVMHAFTCTYMYIYVHTYVQHIYLHVYIGPHINNMPGTI